MKSSTRRLGLLLALVVTILATIMVSEQEDDVVAPIAKAASRPTTHAPRQSDHTQDEAGPIVLSLQPRHFNAEIPELFQPVHPPSPPSPLDQEEIPSTPVAPPLPFKFLGSISEGQDTMVLLSFNGKDVTARQGDTVSGLYHLESVEPEKIEFTYLPLNTRQTLQVRKK